MNVQKVVKSESVCVMNDRNGKSVEKGDKERKGKEAGERERTKGKEKRKRANKRREERVDIKDLGPFAFIFV